MVQPRPIVDAFGHLPEESQILCPQVQSAVGTPEIEALVLAEFALRIFAAVTLPVLARLDRRNDPQLMGVSAPEQRLATVDCAPVAL